MCMRSITCSHKSSLGSLTPFVLSRYIAPHPGAQEGSPSAGGDSYLMMHPVYTKEYLESVHPRHKKPEKVSHHASRLPAGLSRRHGAPVILLTS